MADQLLLLCREDAGLEANKKEPVDLRKLHTDITEAIRPLAESKSIALTLRSGEGVLFFGSSERLRQVFYNLLDNAFKFTGPQGPVHVSIVQRDGAVTCEVSDSGCGLPRNTCPIFSIGSTESTKPQVVTRAMDWG